MTPLSAKSLLIDFYVKCNKSAPIGDEIERLYTPSLSGKGVAERNSLNGRLSQFFNYKDSKAERAKKIASAFAEALAVLRQNRDDLKEVNDPRWKVRLFQELRSDKALRSSLLPLATLPIEDIAEVEAESEENSRVKEAEARRVRFKKSLIRDEVDAFSEDEEVLRRVTSSDITDSEFLTYYIKYLSNHPNLATKNLEVKHKLVEQVIRDQADIQREFFDETKVLTPEARAEKINEGAKAIAEILKARDPGDPWIFAGSYGRKSLNLEKLFTLLKLVPESARASMPDFLQKILQLETLPKPDQFIENQLGSLLSSAESRAKGFPDHESFTFLKQLFSDPSRKLPTSLEKILPNALKKPLEAKLQAGFLESIKPLLNVLNAKDSHELPSVIKAWLPQIFSQKLDASVKKGLLGMLLSLYEHSLPKEVYEPFSLILLNRDLLNKDLDSSSLQLLDYAVSGVSFLPSAGALTCLQLVSKGLECLADKEKYEEVRGQLVEQLKSFTSHPAKKAFRFTDEIVVQAMDTLRQFLPPQLLELFNLDALISYGEFWLEFTKNENGSFDVAVYSSGHIHELQRPDNRAKMAWPLKIRGVAADKLDQGFFTRMLQHHIEPQFDETFTPKASEFVAGVLGYLGGEPGPSQLRTFPQAIENKEQLLNLLLLGPDTPEGVPALSMRLDALVTYLRRFLTDDFKTLEFKQEEDLPPVLAALEKIQAEYTRLKAILPKDYVERVEATLAEIYESVNLAKLKLQPKEPPRPPKVEESSNPRLALGDSTANVLKYIFEKASINSETIKEIKPLLVWAFGDEIEEFIHAVADVVGMKGPESVPSGPKLAAHSLNSSLLKGVEKPKGWLKELLTSWQYTLALSALKTAISMARLYQLTPSLQFAYALNWGLSCVLPTKIYEWYLLVLGTITRKVIEVGVKLVMRCLLNPNSIEELYQFASRARRSAVMFGKRLMGTSELDFQLKSPVLVDDLHLVLGLATGQEVVKVEQSRPYEKYYPSALTKVFQTPDPFSFEFELGQWLENVKALNQGSPLYALGYLLQCIKTLPIPSKTTDDYWKFVNPTEETLVLIQDLGIELNNIGHQLSKSSFYSECTIALYTLLTIMDHLFRKLPDQDLTDFTLNFWDLVLWRSVKGVMVKDPVFAKKLDEIFNYYDVQINPEEPFDPEAWMKKGEQSLFFYPITSRTIFSSGGLNKPESAYIRQRMRKYPEQFLQKVIEISFSRSVLRETLESFRDNFDGFYSSQLGAMFFSQLHRKGAIGVSDLFENKRPTTSFFDTYLDLSPYLDFEWSARSSQEQMAEQKAIEADIANGSVEKKFDRLIFKRLLEPGYEKKYPYLAEAIERLVTDEMISETDQLSIIQHHSNCFKGGQKFFSKAYLAFRQHTLLSSGWLRTGEHPAFSEFNKLFQTAPVYFKNNAGMLEAAAEKIFGSWTPFPSIWDKLGLYPYYTEETFSYRTTPGYFGDNLRAGREMNHPRRTQSDIMAHPDKKMAQKSISHLEIVFTEPSDAIMRQLGHLISRDFEVSSTQDQMELEESLVELEHLLFSHKTLEKQCVENPNWIFAFKDFVIRHFERNHHACEFYISLILLSLNLKKYIASLSNGHQFDFQWIESLFPVLKKLLSAKLKDNPLEADLVIHVLTILSHNKMPEARDQKIRLATSWAVLRLDPKAYFPLLHKPEIVQDRLSVCRHLINKEQTNFDLHKWTFVPEILENLKNKEFRVSFFGELAALLDFPETLTPEGWESPSEGLFINKNFKIDLLLGTTNFLASNQTVKDKIVKVLKVYEILSPIRQLRPDCYETVDGKYRIELTKGMSHKEAESDFSEGRQAKLVELEFFLYRIEGEKKFKLVVNAEALWAEARAQSSSDYALPPMQKLWVEDSRSTIKQVLIDPPAPEFDIVAHGKSLKITLKPRTDLLKPVGYTEVCDLDVLRRFDEFQCFVKPNTTHVTKIVFDKSGLEFEVVQENGKLRARNVADFPGFFIASRQYERYFSRFGTYLLLENARGEKKLLLRKGSWSEHLLMQLVPQMGEWGYKLTPLLSTIKWGRRDGFFTFTVTEANNLASEDPEALLELLTLYVIQEDSAKAEKICMSFERLCRKGPLPIALDNQFIPFLLASGACGYFHQATDYFTHRKSSKETSPAAKLRMTKMRQSLCAAFEENQSLQPEVKPSEGSNILGQLLILAALIYDLQSNLQLNIGDKTIDDYQEWLLYQMVFRRLRSLIQSQKILPDAARKSLEFVGLDTLVENIAFNDALACRYKFLKAKFKEKDSLIVRSLLFAKKAYLTTSPFAGVGSKLTGALPTIGAEGVVAELGQKVKNKMGVSQEKNNSALEIARQILWTKILDLKVLNPEEFSKIEQIVEPVCLDIAEIRPDKLKKHFLGYCKILLVQDDKKSLNRLKNLLNLLQGGWDPQTAILVRMLSWIGSSPGYFWKYEKFELAFKKNEEGENDNQKKPTVKELFEHINRGIFICQTLLLGGKFAFQKVSSFASSQAILNLLPGAGVLPSVLKVVTSVISPTSFLKLANTGGSVVKAAVDTYHASNRYNAPSKETSQKGFAANIFKSLADEDAFFDNFLGGTIFDLVFESTAWQGSDRRLEKFSIEALSSHALTQTYRKINESIDDYYERPDRLPLGIRLKNLDGLYDAYVRLASMRDSLQVQLEEHLKRILNLLKRSVSFESIKKGFLEGDLTSLIKEEGLNGEQLFHLELVIARYILRQTRIQQMNRAMTAFEELVRIEPLSDADLFETKLEQLADELLVRRAYSFHTIDPRLLRRLMVFEFTTNKMIWKKQFERVNELLTDSNKNAVIELLMSLGKTYFCLPLIGSFEADQSKIACYIFPSAIAETNIRQISRQGHDIYAQESNIFRFSRGKLLTKENLDTYLLILHRAKENKETISTTKEDAQALELIFLDRLYQYSTKSSDVKANTLSVQKETLGRLKKFLALLRSHGKAIGDEAHELFNRRQELNYPLGTPSTIKSKYYDVMELVIKKLVKIPQVYKLVRENNLSLLSKQDYEENVVQLLSKKIMGHPFFAVEPSNRQEGIRYLSGKTTTVPEWLKKHPNYDLIALVKGMLTVLLPLTFSKAVNVDFGMSMQDNGEYARPYEGNTSPLEQASIRNPYEAMTKTFIQFLHNGLSYLQYSRLIHFMKVKAKKEAHVRKIPLKETPSERLRNKWEALGGDSEILLKNPEAILMYVRTFVKRQVKYWTQNIRSNAQDFASMFSSGFFDTGTPYNAGTYPANLKMLWDPGTIGEALHLIKSKCPEDGIHLLHETEPKQILQEVLTKFFALDLRFTALIDGSALLKGLDNETVARAMMDFVNQNRPDIKGIVYFMKDKEGKEQLACLERGALAPIQFDLCKLKPEEYLSYFDQRHGFGADIPQRANGKGLNLVGERVSLQRLMQECFRMRGIKKRKKLEGLPGASQLQDEMETTQTIHFALTLQTKTAMVGEGELQLHDIFKFAIKNEAMQAAEDNFEAYKQKVSSTIRRAVFDKMETVTTLDETVEIFIEFMDVLVQKVEDNPKDIFGPIPVQKNPLGEDGVLKAYREQAYKVIEGSSTFTMTEKAEIKAYLESIAIEPMPETVQVFTDEGSLVTGLLDDLAKEVQVEVANETETETETENETARENDQELTLREQLPVYSFKENPWKGIFDPHTIDLSLSKGKEVVHPQFFKLQDLLSRHSFEGFQAIAKTFDERIIFSNNFLPTSVSLFETPVEVASSQQRNLYEVLVQYKPVGKGVEIVSVACLAQRDAAAIRKQFLIDHGFVEQRAFLYDVVSRVPVAGTKMDIELVRNHPELCLIEAQLKFLNGDVTYDKPLQKALKLWIKRLDFRTFKEISEHVHAVRRTKPMFASDLEQILSKYTVSS